MTVIPISCQSEGALEVYIEPVLPVPHLVVVGRSPMAHTLAGLAGALGWRTDLIDGPDFATASAGRALHGRRGHPGPRRRGRAGARGRRPGPPTSAWSARAARGAPCSATSPTAACRRSSSTGCACRPGWTSAVRRIRRSRSPSWPNWSSCAPPARWRVAGSAAATGSARQAGPERDRPQQVSDPVCGMTVTPARRAARCEHDGVDYYFCCAGCRQAFEQDPAAYVKRETRC